MLVLLLVRAKRVYGEGLHDVNCSVGWAFLRIINPAMVWGVWGVINRCTIFGNFAALENWSTDSSGSGEKLSVKLLFSKTKIFCPLILPIHFKLPNWFVNDRPVACHDVHRMRNGLTLTVGGRITVRLVSCWRGKEQHVPTWTTAFKSLLEIMLCLVF